MNRSRFVIFGLAAVALLGVSVAAKSADYWVALDGDDANPGTLEQPFRDPVLAAEKLMPGDTPFLTIENCHLHSSERSHGLYVSQGCHNAVVRHVTSENNRGNSGMQFNAAIGGMTNALVEANMLTRVQFDACEIGRSAPENLKQQIQGKAKPGGIIEVSTQLIVRQSSGNLKKTED